MPFLRACRLGQQEEFQSAGLVERRAVREREVVAPVEYRMRSDPLTRVRESPFLLLHSVAMSARSPAEPQSERNSNEPQSRRKSNDCAVHARPLAASGNAPRAEPWDRLSLS